MLNAFFFRFPTNIRLKMKDELIQFVVGAIKSNYELHKRPTNGARLAEQVRGKFGSDVFQDAGLERLSDVIRIAVDSGDIARNPNVKHLEVWPADVDMSDSATRSAGACFIRTDAWRAFAMQFDEQSVYFNMATKEFVIRTGAAKDDELLVDTPDETEYKRWVSDFSEQSDLKTPQDVLDSPNILRDFSKWMANQQGLNVSTWKKFRATRATQAIRDWGLKANVSTEEFLAAAKRSPRVSKLAAHTQDGSDAFKSAIIRCIQDMTESEIESLAIPVRHVRNHFRPRH